MMWIWGQWPFIGLRSFVQTKIVISHLRTPWLVTAWSGCDCQIVGFLKLQKLADTFPPSSDVGKVCVGRVFQTLFNHLTTTVGVYWPLKCMSRRSVRRSPWASASIYRKQTKAQGEINKLAHCPIFLPLVVLYLVMQIVWVVTAQVFKYLILRLLPKFSWWPSKQLKIEQRQCSSYSG